MGSESGRIAFTITIDNQGKVVIDDTKKQIEGLEKTATGATSKMSDGFRDTWQSMAMGIGTVVAVGAAVIKFSQDALEAERVDSLLASTLRAHGESAKIMGGIYDEWASSMQAMTGIEDEQVKSLISLAYNQGVVKDQINGVVKGSIGLTTLYGGSMQSNLEAVAAAYQGNWRQADALIKELKNLSNESEKMALLQKKMAEGFIASTDAMQGANGAITTAKNQWSDFKESVGGGLLTIFSALKSVDDAFSASGRLASRLRAEQIAYNEAIEKLKKTHLSYADIIADEGIKEKEATEILNRKSIVIKEATVKLVESFQERFDKEQATFKLEQDYIAFVDAKYLPAAKAWLGLLNQMPQSQTNWNVVVAAGIPIMEDMGLKINDTTDKIEAEREAIIKHNEQLSKIEDIGFGVTEALFEIRGVLEDLGYELTEQEEGLWDFGVGLINIGESLIKGDVMGVIAGVVKAIGGLAKAIFGGGESSDEWIARMQREAKTAEALRLSVDQLGDTINGIEYMDINQFEYYANALRNLLTLPALAGNNLGKIGDAFTALLGKAKQLGTEGGAAMIGFFEDVAAKGLRVKEVQDYINASLESGADAYANLKDSIENNTAAQAAFGNISVPIFEEILAYRKKVAENQDLVDSIKYATEVMTDLSNTQKISEDQFYQFSLSAQKSYEQLTAGGMDAGQAMKTMAPYLQRLQFLHEQYGYTIDDATQKLIDEGIASGTVFENQKTESLRMVEALESIVELLSGKLPKSLLTFAESALGAFGKARDAASELNDEIGKMGGGDYGIPGEPDRHGKADVYAAGGFYSPRLSSDTLIQAHRGESVNIVPVGQGGSKTTNLNVIINGPGITPESAADAIITAHRNNTRGLRSLLEN